MQEYIQNYHDLNDTTAYEIFKSITPQEYQTVISDTFKDENRFLKVYRDYGFFAYDMFILFVLELGVLLFAFFKMHTINWKKGPLFYTQREVIFTRRLMTRFDSFSYFVVMLYLSEVIAAWSEYLILGRVNYFKIVDVPMSYLINIIDYIVYLVIFILIGRYLFAHFYVRLDITCNNINFVGTTHSYIDKKRILSVSSVSYSPRYYFKTYGTSILFLKPLVKIETIDNKVIYLRAKNAEHLVEDILEWKNRDDCEKVD